MFYVNCIAIYNKSTSNKLNGSLLIICERQKLVLDVVYSELKMEYYQAIFQYNSS